MLMKAYDDSPELITLGLTVCIHLSIFDATRSVGARSRMTHCMMNIILRGCVLIFEECHREA